MLPTPLQHRLDFAEHELSSPVMHHTTTSASPAAPIPAQVEDARAEAEALRRLVKLKTRELKNIRRLAQVSWNK
jgi:hypothetical protein